LTPGQRLFQVLARFDGQVCNGGITQFFWNYPEHIAHVGDALQVLGEVELFEAYSKAVASLVGKERDWVQLRKEAFRTPARPDWEPFQKSYELLDLSWFDGAYYDRWGYDAAGQWVKLGEGFKVPFLRRLAAYVKAHPEEFITV